MLGLVAHLLVSEAELGETGGGVGLVAEPVPSLLGRGAVVAKPVGLDDQAELRPVEVDFELVHPLAGKRDGQSGAGGDREESTFELLLGETKGAPVEDAAKQGHARLAGAPIQRRTQFRRMHEVIFVRLVDRPLDATPVEPGRDVDQGLDGSGDRDVIPDRDVFGPE
jgi:hypothetical protein